MVSPLVGSAFFCFQTSLPGVGVERDDLAVQRVHQDLALGVVGAAMHEVAARHGHGAVILLRRVLPLDRRALLGEVEGKHVIRVRGDDVHRVVDDERLALVAPERPGGEGPDLLELRDVRGVDLVQAAVAGRGVVLPGDDPNAVVVLKFQQFVVGGGAPGKHQRRRHHEPSDPLHRVPPSQAQVKLGVESGQPGKEEHPSFRLAKSTKTSAW